MSRRNIKRLQRKRDLKATKEQRKLEQISYSAGCRDALQDTVRYFDALKQVDQTAYDAGYKHGCAILGEQQWMRVKEFIQKSCLIISISAMCIATGAVAWKSF